MFCSPQNHGFPHFPRRFKQKSRSRGIFCSFLYIFFPEFIFFIAEAAADLDLVRIGEEIIYIFSENDDIAERILPLSQSQR